MRRNSLLALSLFLLLLIAPPASAAPTLSAFPGAEGFGSSSPGGRGGQVIAVTNLNDSGPGSLREAIETPGPRIVIFQVGGRIWLNTRIRLQEPYITLAGQTAPGGGIELANADNLKAPLRIETHDVVIRNLRFRPGPGGDRDALSIFGPAGVHSVVIDHVSLSWGVDENFGVFGDATDISLQWSIISEPLECSTHPLGCLGMGILLQGGRRVTLHHNLIAHARERSPRISGEGVFDFVNNVVYNPGFTNSWGPMHVENNEPNEISRVNVVGNHYVPGPESGSAAWYVDGGGVFSVYASGNAVPGALIRPGQEGHLLLTAHPVSQPVWTQAALDASSAVLAAAGASFGVACDGSVYLRRDPVDARVVADVGAGTGSVIDDPSEVGGWPAIDAGSPCADADADGLPDAWETLHGTDPLVATGPDGPHGDANGDCYSNIENYFNPDADTDADGVSDPLDNCPQHANPTQLDADADGYGNRCDADFDQDEAVGLGDLGAISQHLGSDCDDLDYVLHLDLDAPASCASSCDPLMCNIGAQDLAVLAAGFGSAPGPGRGCP